MVLSVNTGGGSRALTTAEQIGIRDEVVIGTMPAGRGNLLTGALQQALAALGGTILFAAIGDSIANVSGTTSLHNWRTQSVSGNALNPERDAAWLQFLSGGTLRLAANCGISGENTTQLLARDDAAAATNRRAIIDAANLGVQLGTLSIGINDLQQNIFSTTTTTARDTYLTGTLYPALLRILRRTAALGILPVYLSLGGYDYGTFAAANPATFPNGAADVTARRAVIAIVNAYVRDVLIPQVPGAIFVDVNANTVNTDGSWKTGMSIDGLHPSKLGAKTRAEAIVSALLGSVDVLTSLRVYRPGGTNSINAFSNPHLEKTSGNGAAGVAAVYSQGGAATFSNSVVTAYGRAWQSTVVTPSAQDANGSAGVVIEFDLSVYGASPLVSLAAGDLLGTEALLVIDNGAEGVSPTGVFSFAGRTRMWYAAGASNTYVDGIAYDLTAANQVNLPGPIKGRLVNPPMPAPDLSANLTAAKLIVFVFSRVLQPFRVLVSGVGAVKVPATF